MESLFTVFSLVNSFYSNHPIKVQEVSFTQQWFATILSQHFVCIIHLSVFLGILVVYVVSFLWWIITNSPLIKDNWMLKFVWNNNNMSIVRSVSCQSLFLASDFKCLFIFSVIAFTALNMKFSIKDFFSKCDQIHRKLRSWSLLLKKAIMENFSFCVVIVEILMSCHCCLLGRWLSSSSINFFVCQYCAIC